MKKPLRLTCAGLALLLASHLFLPVSASLHFQDVSGWAEEYAEEAFTRGLVKGIGEGRFAPDRTVTYS